MGSTLDVRSIGDPARGDAGGGGVVDMARGVAWFDAVGEAPGEDGCGEERFVTLILRGRWPLVSSAAAEVSTSFSRDCRKLGPVEVSSAGAAGCSGCG